MDPTARVAAPARVRDESGFAGLPAEDAAIPFDRVPYVPGDLRRVAVMAVAMVVLIVVANVVISRLTG